MSAKSQEVFQPFSVLPTESKRAWHFATPNRIIWEGQEHTLTGLLPIFNDFRMFSSYKSLSYFSSYKTKPKIFLCPLVHHPIKLVLLTFHNFFNLLAGCR